MTPAIYFVVPRPPVEDMRIFSAQGLARARMSADLSLPTVAALAPPGLDMALCDEEIEHVDFDTAAPVVGLTCRMGNEPRVLELAAEFRKRGKTVVVGGPGALSSCNLLRPHCDVLVFGELEAMADVFYRDLIANRLEPTYRGEVPDLSTAPVPRWDLVRHERVLVATIQTARGCPFECEFCDVPIMHGRKQRFKGDAQVIAELDMLYALGYRFISIVDDNLTVNRRRARELLTAIADWNHARPDGAVLFSALVSMDAAREPELLDLCARAGIVWVFIGIESVNTESLKETKKRQNLNIDLIERIERFLDHGIMVAGGLIVGFDSDGPDIFVRQQAFGTTAPVPVLVVNTLSALTGTPLHARLEKEGRLVPNQGSRGLGLTYASDTTFQVIPKQMSHEALLAGHRWLVKELFSHRLFGSRLERFTDGFRPNPDAPVFATRAQMRQVEQEAIYDVVDRFAAGTDLRAWARRHERPGLELLTRVALFQYARLGAPGHYARQVALTH